MLLTALPAGAETIDELRAQLAAQKRINELLKQRIRTLEADPAAHGAPKPPPPVAAQETPQDEEEDRALERALERRGAAVLRPGVVEVTPSFSWTHSGKEANRSSDDIYTAAVDGRVGLPGGWMIGAKAPFLLRSRAGFDDNLGVGDVSAQIWKQIMVQDGTLPSLVGSLRYTAPTGEDFSEASVPLGSGFHRLSSQLSAVKSIAPIAYWGNASYTHNFTRSFDGVEIDRSGTFGFEAGATLAVTPEISLTTSVDFAFEGKARRDGAKVPGSGFTVGTVELGTGILLSKDVFLIVSGAFGVTDDAPDVTLGVSLPVRF
jgi:hypothetical protein